MLWGLLNYTIIVKIDIFFFSQSAIVGERVTLPCRVANREGAVQWTKDGFGLGTHRNLSGYDRYAMIGSDEEGKVSKEIKLRYFNLDKACIVGTRQLIIKHLQFFFC